MSRKLFLTTFFIIVLIGVLSLSFEVQRVEASGTIYIRADGSIDPPDAPISTLDNVTYTFTGNINDSIVVERDNAAVDGAGYILSIGYLPNDISLYDRSNVTIKNMKIQGSWLRAGIQLARSSNCTISGNNITADSPLLPWGLRLDNSSDNKIVNNTFTNNGLYAIFSYQNTVVNNIVNGKPLVYLEDVSDHGVNDAGQVILLRCNNVTVKDLDLFSTTAGVELFETNNTIISENNITANNLGILLEGSSNNIIIKNNITKNSVGIWLESKRAHESTNNTISGNRIAENSYGIYLQSSNHNRMSGNNLTNNEEGIQLMLASYNLVCENNIIENEYGISEGGLLDEPYDSNNTIYHNNFVNNTNQAIPSYSNVWDDGIEGNYWSNYTGVDLDHDGIGDTAHVIDANNTDHYPLMSMFSSFNTLYNHQINIVSNSSISHFDFNVVGQYQAMLTFDVTVDTGTQGFCRICIPRALINSSYVVKLSGEVINEPQARQLPCSNETYEYLYINYAHSEHTIEVSGPTPIAEFSSFLILPLFFMVILLAVIVHRRRYAQRK